MHSLDDGCVSSIPRLLEKVFNKMLEINDRPVLVDCVVDPDDMVFPMVPAGGNNDQIILNEEDLKNL